MAPALGAHRATDGTVLLVSNYSNRTGYAWHNIHRLFSDLASTFRDRGARVIISFDRIEGDVVCVDPATFDEAVELPPDGYTPRALLRWIRLIRTRRVRWIYLTDQRIVSWRYAVFRLFGVRRIIVHCRVSVADPMPAAPERGWRGAAKWLLSRLPWLHADQVYAVSDFVRDRLVQKARFAPMRVHTILNGIDLDRFRPQPPRSDGMLRVFAGGRATHHKGIDVLIRAIAHLVAAVQPLPPFTVRYAGDGPDLDVFRRLADRLGVAARIEFLGEVQSTQSLLAEADIVVVPSVWGDACPSAVSEALAAGRPLIATRVGGVPELIGDPGNALLVPPADVEALAEGLRRLLCDPELRSTLGARARLQAEDALDERRYHEHVRSRLLLDFGL